MANKISVILDVATDKAVSGLKGFKNSIADADGAMGKMKAGAGAAFGALQGAAVTALAAAGAAAVAFSVKSVQAFTDTAVAAGKLADATGLSSEEASKWTAVADDIGISAESMEKSFGKLAVSIGKNNPLLEQYGITVKKGADGQADMNATMLNAIDVINGIEDPTKKAAVAQAALGKGWMDMSELIEQGSGTLTESMAEVSEAQVIDPEEVEKARKMRAAMDNLQDAIRDVSLTLGEDLVPMAVAGADALTLLIEPLSSVNQWTKDVALGFLELVGVIDKLPGPSEDAATGFGQMATMLDQLASSTTADEEVMIALNAAIMAGIAAGGNLEPVIEALKDAIDDKRDADAEAEQAAKEHTEALEDQMKATDDLYSSKLKLVGGDIAVRDSQRQAAEAVAALTALTAEGKGGTDEYAAAQDAAAQALIDSAAAASEYEISQREANGETLSGESKTNNYIGKLRDLAATLGPNDPLRAQLAGYIAELEAIKPEYNTRLNLRITGATVTSDGDLIGVSGPRASGGPVSSGQTYLVGEQGPELLTMGGNGYVTPNSQLAAAGAAPIVLTVNAGMGADGKEIGDVIVGKLREYERRNGPGWRS
jgi:hypothetical protein